MEISILSQNSRERDDSTTGADSDSICGVSESPFRGAAIARRDAGARNETYLL